VRFGFHHISGATLVIGGGLRRKSNTRKITRMALKTVHMTIFALDAMVLYIAGNEAM
jgi:hypothetical protein